MPPRSFKKETTIQKIARTYDQERVYNMYISNILKQRKATNLAFKTPKSNFTDKMEILAVKVENKLLTTKSPDEETCNIGIKNCVHRREQLLSQLYI